ncbi:MAG: heparan-alpha-glucosaminide N-acetyltransferase domain-containing protein [Muribaculaceae bacterium]|nr:heparan-alpha-glucosaminide N-acetyltransferase domain-containing protein [Muribaculaceae bacterium]
MSDKPKQGRLLALDILRGITVAGMIMVNNPGSWGHIYAPLAHAQWHGLTPTDLVFPFFMFIMGVSTYMSLRRYDFRMSRAAALKILRRTAVIFLIGLAIAWLSLTLRRLAAGGGIVEAAVNFDHIRMLGVMPRLALCYGAGSLLALSMGRRALARTVAGILVAYAAVLLLGHGLEFSERNIIAAADRAVLGENHMYSDTVGGVTLHFDPEGLLSTIPSVAHMLIGFLCGSMLMAVADNRERICRLFIVGTVLTFSGLLLAYGIPVNKKIWSPTFVLTTCGMAASLLGLLIWIIDIRGHRRWCRFFEAFGVNPLFMYCLGAVLTILMGFIRVPYAAAEAGSISLKGWIYRAVCMPMAGDDATLASLLFALAFVAFNWVFGYILYKKKIYIKI